EVGQRQAELAAGLGVDAEALLAEEWEELSRLALGAALLGEAAAPVKARGMAKGGLMANRPGAAYLAGHGIGVAWLDARTALVARGEHAAHLPRAYLAASCSAERDPALAARLAAEGAAVVLTQGFIAGNVAGEAVLLGRGGSDVSAALFAAKLGAARCEIWTDVPGMFTANQGLLPGARPPRHVPRHPGAPPRPRPAAPPRLRGGAGDRHHGGPGAPPAGDPAARPPWHPAPHPVHGAARRAGDGGVGRGAERR